MMERGILIAWRLMFRGWRGLLVIPLMLVVGWVAVGGLLHMGPRYGPANAWDALVFGGVTAQTLALFVAPIFLLATHRDMTKAWEIHIWIHLRSRRIWWGSDMIALAAAASLYALATGLGSLGFGGVTLPVSWSWSALARGRRPVGLSSFVATPQSPPPLVVGLEIVALLALGLWLLAVLTRTLTVLLKSPWLGLVLTWALVLFQYGLVQFGALGILPWMPGDQFVYLMHFMGVGPRIPVEWSVAYGIAWLAILIVVGGAAAHRDWSL